MNIGWNVIKGAKVEHWVKSLQEISIELKETANANMITDTDFALLSQMGKFSDPPAQNPSALLSCSCFLPLSIHHSQTSHWAAGLDSPFLL